MPTDSKPACKNSAKRSLVVGSYAVMLGAPSVGGVSAGDSAAWVPAAICVATSSGAGPTSSAGVGQHLLVAWVGQRQQCQSVVAAGLQPCVDIGSR